jgi:hypothetical protein
MGYSLFISINTFVDSDKLPQYKKVNIGWSKHLTISEIIMNLRGWDFAEQIVPNYCSDDKGEIDSEELLELYQEYCELKEETPDDDLIQLIENSEYGWEDGNSFFEYSQSY